MPITSTGIGSGLDIEGLVSQLIQAESQPKELRINRQQNALQAELSAYGTIQGALSGLQLAAAGAKSAATFQQRNAVVSDDAAISVSADSSAAIGTFSLAVSALATSHSLASQAYSAVTDVVGTGTITVRFGTTDYDAGTDTYNSFTQNAQSSTASFVIDTENNTLEGIRDTINKADAGVAAVIVNDGSGFKLLVNAVATGAENSLEFVVTNDGDANNTDASGLSALSFSAAATHLGQTVAAQDAQLTVNGLAITSASNELPDVIDGITLNLKQVTAAPVSLSVTKDVQAVRSAIETLVNGYRAFNAVANQLSAFDADSKQGNILLGDATLRSAASSLRRIINNPVENLSTTFSSLSEIGITTDVNGSLTIDTAKLDTIIDENFESIAGLFSAIGQIDDDFISFAGAGSATEIGLHAVEITQLATQGTFVGNSVLPDFGVGSVTIDDTNDSLTVEIDGVTGSAISLTLGVYTSGESLAQEIKTRLNGVPEFLSAGIVVDVVFDAGSNSLSIISDRYGNESSVNVTGIDSFTAGTLGFTVTSGSTGQDVVGTIGGTAAVGNGQALTGAAGSPADGLVISVTGGATGSRGSISFSRGIGDVIDSTITDMLSDDGLLSARTTGITASLAALEEDLVSHRLRMETIEARYRAQFSALDSLVAQLQSTGSFLTSALASLPGTRLSSN